MSTKSDDWRCGLHYLFIILTLPVSWLCCLCYTYIMYIKTYSYIKISVAHKNVCIIRQIAVLVSIVVNTISSHYHNKTPQRVWLKQQTFFFHSSRGRKSKFRVPAGSGSGKGPLSGPCLAVQSHWWWKRPSISTSFYKGISTVKRVPLSQPNLTIIIFQRLCLQIPSHWRLGL